jgi:hypothetical protein
MNSTGTGTINLGLEVWLPQTTHKLMLRKNRTKSLTEGDVLGGRMKMCKTDQCLSYKAREVLELVHRVKVSNYYC